MRQQAVETGKKNFRCLIADDSTFARRNIGKIISTIGGEVVAEARNGTEAVDLYAKLNPDLVLLDITMPELDGVETLRRIIEQNRSAKVIMVSSIGHKEMVWKSICLGAKHFITKPFKPGYAETVIESVINDSRRN